MGHIQNVEALEKLLGICTGYGVRYNPVYPKLQLANMNALLNAAHEALRNERDARISYNNVINARRTTFLEIRPLASRIIKLMEASGAAALTLEDAKAFNLHTYGRLSKQREPVSSEAAKTRRSSREVSFTKMLDNFEQLVKTATSDPLYRSNETDLSVAGLNERLATLKASHSAAMEAKINWRNGMISRDHVLYDSESAVYNTGRKVKLYLKALVGPNAREAGLLREIVFTRPS